MSYIAIVLTEKSQERCKIHAEKLGIDFIEREPKCHHVTLALGAISGFKRGTERVLTATHYGKIEGRVYAFRVSGAEDSKNMFPHVTIAVDNGAKPRESNEITEWQELPRPFQLVGYVTLCE